MCGLKIVISVCDTPPNLWILYPLCAADDFTTEEPRVSKMDEILLSMLFSMESQSPSEEEYSGEESGEEEAEGLGYTVGDIDRVDQSDRVWFFSVLNRKVTI